MLLIKARNARLKAEEEAKQPDGVIPLRRAGSFEEKAEKTFVIKPGPGLLPRDSLSPLKMAKNPSSIKSEPIPRLKSK